MGGWHGWLLWVVRPKVKELSTKQKLRGWAFGPVLVTNTDLYADYLGQWERLSRLVGQYTKGQFCGGQLVSCDWKPDPWRAKVVDIVVIRESASNTARTHRKDS